MSGWNYRVIKIQNENEKYFTVAEVYYDEENSPIGWVECKKSAFIWEEYESLKGTMEFIKEAFDKPILIVEGDKLRELK